MSSLSTRPCSESTAHNESSNFPSRDFQRGMHPSPASGHTADDSSDTGRVMPRVLHVGIDLGTATTCVASAWAGDPASTRFEIWPTIVGYAKEGVVENLIPGNADVLCGQEAIRHRLHLNMVHPMAGAIIQSPEAARDFARYLRQHLPHGDSVETRVVVGIPANASSAARQAIREALGDVFDRLILVPKCFLAAIGCRQESRLDQPGYVDPVVNSLWIDIGAGTTELCLLQGCYPGAEEQMSLPVGGDFLDGRLMDGLKSCHPDIRISPLKIRELKEQLACAGVPDAPAIAELFVGGRLQKVDVSQVMNEACHQLVSTLADAIQTLISRADSESSPQLIKNIFLTGGGAGIRNIARELQRILHTLGLEEAQVHRLEEATKQSLAHGALKASRQAREKQWQILLK